jgi:hypothetical protein
MLGNWEITAGTDWKDRPKAWLKGSGLDVWFIQREQVGPEQYAETWLQDASQNREREQYKESYAAYLDDFASRKVEGIGFGMIWLRRPGSPHQATINRFEEITYPMEQPIGPHLGAAPLNGQTGSRPMRSSMAHLVVAEDVTEERHQRPGAAHPGVILLRQGAGLRRTNLLSTELAGFVSACDGQLSVRQIASALVSLLGGGRTSMKTLSGQASCGTSPTWCPGRVLPSRSGRQRRMSGDALRPGTKASPPGSDPDYTDEVIANNETSQRQATFHGGNGLRRRLRSPIPRPSVPWRTLPALRSFPSSTPPR